MFVKISAYKCETKSYLPILLSTLILSSDSLSYRLHRKIEFKHKMSHNFQKYFKEQTCSPIWQIIMPYLKQMASLKTSSHKTNCFDENENKSLIECLQMCKLKIQFNFSIIWYHTSRWWSSWRCGRSCGCYCCCCCSCRTEETTLP